MTELHRSLQGCDKRGQSSWGPTSSRRRTPAGQQEAQYEHGTSREGWRFSPSCGGAGGCAGPRCGHIHCREAALTAKGKSSCWAYCFPHWKQKKPAQNTQHFPDCGGDGKAGRKPVQRGSTPIRLKGSSRSHSRGAAAADCAPAAGRARGSAGRLCPPRQSGGRGRGSEGWLQVLQGGRPAAREQGGRGGMLHRGQRIRPAPVRAGLGRLGR